MGEKLGRATLDLDSLVAEGHLSNEMAIKLAKHKVVSGATNHLISVLYIIGALAAAAGVVLLKPTATTGLIIALVCLVCGQFIHRRGMDHLRILALALGIGSAAGLTGWFVLEFGENLPGWVVHSFATAVTLIIAILFRSKFLAAIVPLGIGAIIGSGGAYWHAAYGIFVREAAITAVLFTVLTAGGFWLAKRISHLHEDWPDMASIAARMSFIIANFGFWVGSLWGDYVGEYIFGRGERRPDAKWEEVKAARDAFRETALYIHEDIFAVCWALFAIAAILIGNRFGNRFIALSGVVFLAINAFTQYFEYFQDEPWALIFGGIGLVGVALGLVKYEMNKAKDA